MNVESMNPNWAICPSMAPFYSNTKITTLFLIYAANEIQQSFMAIHTSYTTFLPQTYI